MIAALSSHPTTVLACDLIRCPSVTPHDHGAQEILAHRLSQLGFQITTVDHNGVKNLWAELGNTNPLFVFAGHTDVVPPGDATLWKNDPFRPVLEGGYLYGRGAADMKGNIAAFIVSIEQYLKEHGQPTGFSLGVLIAGDEEAENSYGTLAILELLFSKGKKIDFCIMAEPSSYERLGDCIRIGRRGSLTGTWKVYGVQGHAAYPDRAKNPIHHVLQPLSSLAQEIWDQGDHNFPPSTLQITNIFSGTGASNVIPGILEVKFNIRFSPVWTMEKIQARCGEILAQCGLASEIQWSEGARPFLTDASYLRELVIQTIQQHAGIEPMLSTAGGTSDARFIAPTGAEVIEFGLINKTVHQANECVSVTDLIHLTDIFEALLVKMNETFRT